MKITQNNKEEKERVTVHRTTEGTIFELTFVILAVIVWVLIFVMLNNAPDVVVTHFDGRGHPNGYGSPWGLLVPCAIITVVGAALLAVAYRPHLINMPVEVKTKRQYELAIRSTRIAALMLLPLTLSIPCSLLLTDRPSPWPVLAIVGLLVLVAIYYSIRIYQARPLQQKD